MGEFQSWLDKAECVIDLPVQPDHREQLNTALEKVQVELFLNPKALFSKYMKINIQPDRVVWIGSELSMSLLSFWRVQPQVAELPNRTKLLHQMKTKFSSLPTDKNKTLENSFKIINMRWAKVILVVCFAMLYFSD